MRWIFIVIHETLIFLISKLINLSASNDASMHSQEHIEERYSSDPYI